MKNTFDYFISYIWERSNDDFGFENAVLMEIPQDFTADFIEQATFNLKEELKDKGYIAVTIISIQQLKSKELH